MDLFVKMREFVYYSKSAPTTGKFSDDLKKAGRLDVALNSFLQVFYVSNDVRKDTTLHLIFDGPPDAPKHLIINPSKTNKVTLSKKDLLWAIRKLLLKYKQGEKVEYKPGYEVEKKDLLTVLDEMKAAGKQVYLLDENGDDIREVEMHGDEVFVLGDHEGFDPKQKKLLRRKFYSISVGDTQYLASQTIMLVHNELDRDLGFNSVKLKK